VQSLTEVDPELWLKSVRAASYRRRGRLPAASSMTNARHDLEWMQQALQLRHSPLAWWEHDIWSPIDDARIPIKGYEPSCNHRINFSHTHNTWLQDALKYRFRLLLETGAGTWGTLLSARTHLGRYLDDYLAAATAATGVDHGPPLVANPADEIRTVALEFLSSLHSRVGETGAARGNRFSRKTIYHSQVALSTFYEFAFRQPPRARAGAAGATVASGDGVTHPDLPPRRHPQRAPPPNLGFFRPGPRSHRRRGPVPDAGVPGHSGAARRSDL